MMNLVANLISIALYVLYAIGLYTIAQRRGIQHAWLSWVPFGNMWILGSIADDYMARRTGRKPGMRIALTILNIAVSVLAMACLICTFSVLSNVLTVNEITDLYLSSAGTGDDLYAVSQEEMIQQLSQNIEARMTDEAVEKIITGSMIMMAVCLVMLGAAIAQIVVECICLYRLFDSCDPQNKLLYLLLGLLLGVMQVFVFLCRDKDLGLAPPPPPVCGYMPPPQDYQYE